MPVLARPERRAGNLVAPASLPTMLRIVLEAAFRGVMRGRVIASARAGRQAQR